MGKFIFIDVDGTLVDYENNLPDSAVEAIRLARKNSHKVYICTGRSRAEVYQSIWDIGLDGMIGGNGAYVEDNGKVVCHQLITAEQCKNIVDWLHNRNLEFYLESNNGLFASEHFETVAEPVIRKYAAYKGKEDADKVTVRTIFPDMIFNGNLYRDDLNKISFILNTYDDYLAAKEAFPDLKVGTWGGKGDTALFGDFGVKNLSKSRGIEILLKYLNADKADTIAFGDSKWDIDMFKYCAISVCVGDGGDDAKAAATFVTDAVMDNGIFNAFKKLNLI
ncbi:MAG: HAD family phosphatase [Selenomonadaceae bacterium]|nr:HAD family phosphatase [Selenomonadaceae bacterium]MBR1858013.1 HAD family phosphatase [Selenomonadaceae bacterium]